MASVRARNQSQTGSLIAVADKGLSCAGLGLPLGAPVLVPISNFIMCLGG